jgi:hypothetical protein
MKEKMAKGMGGDYFANLKKKMSNQASFPRSPCPQTALVTAAPVARRAAAGSG